MNLTRFGISHLPGRRVLLALALVLLVTAPSARAQAPSQDAQLTQTLINEIRQLRQDLQLTAAVIQRAQILMYRLQVETGNLSRATQRLDDARRNCSTMQSQVRSLNMQVDQFEARLRAAQNPADQKAAEDNLTRMKSQLALFTNEEQQCHPREYEAQSQVQAAQSSVDSLQSQLDKIDKALAGVGPQ